MAKAARIGQAELEILNYINDHHPVTVRQVADWLGREKGVVRTTVLNVMARLKTKGYLVRKKDKGLFWYSPRLAKPRLLRGLVREFVDKALGGSVSPFVSYLAEDPRLSAIEIEQLKEIIRSLENEKRA